MELGIHERSQELLGAPLLGLFKHLFFNSTHNENILMREFLHGLHEDIYILQFSVGVLAFDVLVEMRAFRLGCH